MRLPAFALMTFGCAALGGVARAGEESIRLVEAEGRDTTATHCAICHSLDYIPMNAAVMDRTGWEKALQKMITRFGAPIDEAAARDILEYLSTHYTVAPAPRP